MSIMSSSNTSRVVALSLPKRNLQGPIPGAVCGLSALSFLNLSGSDEYNSIDGFGYWLSGPIPSCIAHNLTRLQTLDLSFNGLSGSLSPLVNLPHLTHLDLSYNSFSGALPILINTPSLQYLDLKSNSFSGTMPLFNTPSLQYLDLSFNLNADSNLPSLSGSVSPLLNLSHLTHLDLSLNSFSGSLPIFNILTKLEYLDVSINHFSGNLPPFINTPRLQHLDVSENLFSGNLPPFNTPRLQHLDVSGNLFSGNLPPFNTTTQLQYLQHLGLSRNRWKGDIRSLGAHLPHLEELELYETSLDARGSSIAQLFCDLKSLKFLAITRSTAKFAKLDQSPPQCERPSVNLTHLYLSINGPLPPWMGMFPKLHYLALSATNLSGSIPQEWQALTHLTSLELFSDSPSTLVYLSPGFFAWLFRLPLERLTLVSMGLTTQHFQSCELGLSLLNQTLRYLSLSQNHLSHGQSLWHCLALHNFTLSDLDLSNNPLNFNLALAHPLSLVPLYIYSSLDLSYCQLFGDLSIEILSAASWLILAHNDFAGSIPSQIGSFGSLASPTEWLDLSFNNLTGPFPISMGNLTSAQAIILNNNHLDGEISLQHLGQSLSSVLQLANNSFTKASLIRNTSLSNLVTLDLSFNKLEGDLQELLNAGDHTTTVLSSLYVLILGHNQLTGSIPTLCWESSPNLAVMDLSNNKLTGAIPESLKLLQCLRLDRSCKDLTYILHPYSLQSVKNVKFSGSHLLGYLDLSSNMLSGPIPEELGELLELTDLNLSNNHLWGPIPPSLANLSLLESLDLSYNNLQGSIPTALSQLSNLAVFNVSFNPELRGQIPQGSPQLENEDSYKGDPNLCGLFIRKECTVTTSKYVPATTSSELDPGSLHNVLQWIEEWISIPGICLAYTLGFALTIWFLKLIHFYG